MAHEVSSNGWAVHSMKPSEAIPTRPLYLLGFFSEERYRLGTQLLHLGALVKAAYPARQVALPLMDALREATGQSVQWVVRDGQEGVYLEVLEARSRVRLYIAPGRRAPLYAGASTRLLLAFAPAEVQRAVFQQERRRLVSRARPCHF